MLAGRKRVAGAAMALLLAAGSGAFAGSTAYTYDELGRVTSVTDSDGTTITYAYDPMGNRTQQVTSGSTNHAPIAVGDTVSTAAGTTLDFDPRANDSDPDGDVLTLSSVGSASHGATSVVGSGATAQARYIPTAGYAGTDSFSYTIADSHGSTASATVSVTVTTTNNAPVAVADAISTPLNTAKTFDPRTNDTDADGDTLSVSAVGSASHGTTSYASTSVTYTPTTSYAGADSFSYTVSDGHGGSSSATVSVTVTSGNQAPTAVADSISFTTTNFSNMAYDVYPLGNDTDPDGDTLTISSVTTPTNSASASVVSNYVHLTGLHMGVTTFNYTISDGHGHTATATVTIDREHDDSGGGGDCGGPHQPACP